MDDQELRKSMVAENNQNWLETKESAKSTFAKSVVAEKGQNSDDTTQAKDKCNSNKDDNVADRETPSC